MTYEIIILAISYECSKTQVTIVSRVIGRKDESARMSCKKNSNRIAYPACREKCASCKFSRKYASMAGECKTDDDKIFYERLFLSLLYKSK